MTARKSVPVALRPDWTRSFTVKLDGHRFELTPGVELTVQLGKRRTRCRFLNAVEATTIGSSWLNVFDGKSVRSIVPGQVVTVHRTHKVPRRGAE